MNKPRALSTVFRILNTQEMYYALRRLGKEVVWVHYMGGGHGVPMNTLSDFTDFHNRILGWYDEKLKKGDRPVP